MHRWVTGTVFCLHKLQTCIVLCIAKHGCVLTHMHILMYTAHCFIANVDYNEVLQALTSVEFIFSPSSSMKRSVVDQPFQCVNISIVSDDIV